MISVKEALVQATSERAPIFYIHPKEEYFPSIPPKSSFIFRELCKKGLQKKYPVKLHPKIPVYYSAFLDKYAKNFAVTYWCFYNRSEVDVKDFPDVGIHDGDWEWVGFFVPLDDSNQLVNMDEIKYYLGQHQDDGTHKTVVVQPSVEDKHPVFYVARKSHSNYIDAGYRTGMNLALGDDSNPIVKALQGVSKAILSTVTFDPREKGPRWAPVVKSITEQPWFLNRGKWGLSKNSPMSPIVQMDKPHACAGIRKPLAFSIVPLNLKFLKGTEYWNTSDAIDRFEVMIDNNLPGESNILLISKKPGTQQPAALYQELEGETRAGDEITLRINLRYLEDSWVDEPVQIRIHELAFGLEKHSEREITHEKGKGYKWYSLQRSIEENAYNKIRFEITCPEDITLCVNRFEIGIKADGLLYLEKSSNTLKEYKRLWFGRSSGDTHK